MTAEQQTPREIVKSLDPNLNETDEAFRFACILVASLQVGPDVRRCAKLAGFPVSQVSYDARKIREARIWQGKKVNGAQWFEEDGGIAFWCDVATCQGLLQRVYTRQESPDA